MSRSGRSHDNTVVSVSALDMFANALGTLAFLLLLFAVNTIELVRPSAIKIITRRIPPARVGSAYLAVLAPEGGVPPYLWEIATGTLPDGLKLDQDRGEIVGSPFATAAGREFPVIVQVNDARRRRAQGRFVVQVLPAPQPGQEVSEPLTLLSRGTLPDALVGRPYQLSLAARGGSGRYRWAVVDLPAGFSVTPTGILQGIGAQPGKFSLVLRVEDEKVGSGDAGLVTAPAFLKILETDKGAPAESPPPSIVTDRLMSATRAQPFEIPLLGLGARPLRWSARNLPAGMHLEPEGTLRGIPAAEGVTQIVVSMEDAQNRKAIDRLLTFKVNAAPVSAMERLQQRGLWGWIGYGLLALVEIAFLFFLGRLAGRRVDALLKLHQVNLIRKADGTTALNGPKEATDVVAQKCREMYEKHRRAKVVSFVALAVSLIAYTLFLVG